MSQAQNVPPGGPDGPDDSSIMHSRGERFIARHEGAPAHASLSLAPRVALTEPDPLLSPAPVARFIWRRRDDRLLLRIPRGEEPAGLRNGGYRASHLLSRLHAAERRSLGRAIACLDRGTRDLLAHVVRLPSAPDGDTPLLVLARAARDRAGRLRRLHGELLDLTGTTAQLLGVTAERDFLQRVIDTVDNLVFVKDAEGRFRFVNRAFAQSFGRRVDEVRMRSNEDVHVNAEELEHFKAVDRRVLERGETVTVEDRVTLPDGRRLWYLTRKTPLETGAAPALLGVAVDITALKEAQQRAQHLYERQLVLSRISQLATSTAPLEEVLTLAIDAIGTAPDAAECACLGILIRGARADGGDLLFSRPDRPPLPPDVVEAMQRRLESPDPASDRRLLVAPIRSGGATVGVLASAFEPGANDDRIGFLQAIADVLGGVIAAHRAAESQRRAVVAADQANRTKTDFLATVSHELRTPLNGVMGMLSLMLDAETLPDDQRAFAATALTAAENLHSLVEGLLDLTRIERGVVETVASPLDVAAMVRDVVRLLAPTVASRPIALRHAVDDRFDPPFRTDPMHVRRILINLLTNALKFTRRGEVEIRAAAERDGDGGRVLCLSVRDTGIGIPPTERDRIFERFTQVDSSIRRHYGGLGIGLALCRDLAMLLGGSLSVESALGHGSTFTLRVPEMRSVSHERPVA